MTTNDQTHIYMVGLSLATTSKKIRTKSIRATATEKKKNWGTIDRFVINSDTPSVQTRRSIPEQLFRKLFRFHSTGLV